MRARGTAAKFGVLPQAAPVEVIMDSDSNLPVMLPAARILDRFHMPYDGRSSRCIARRTGWWSTRGLQRREGAAAHLPGMVAAVTTLPVIGVPRKGAPWMGWIFCSVVQMPVSLYILYHVSLLMSSHLGSVRSQ
jgi:phosphoribosylcarboxyaminoimidazole (NCAIR) mutase